VYKRATIYTWGLVVSNLVACAFAFYEHVGASKPVIYSPPKLVFV
jgi:hypothetical protein